MWRAVERVTSSTGLCLPADFAPWSEPTGRNGASCDGILWLRELWGCTITESTFPSPLTLRGVVFVGQEGMKGGGWGVEEPMFGFGAAVRYATRGVQPPTRTPNSQISRQGRRLFFSLLIAIFGGLKGGVHKVHFYGQDGCCSILARPPAAWCCSRRNAVDCRLTAKPCCRLI